MPASSYKFRHNYLIIHFNYFGFLNREIIKVLYTYRSHGISEEMIMSKITKWLQDWRDGLREKIRQ